MKFATQIFPKGVFDNQKTDGAYINETLGHNLDVLAKKITKDMHFLGLISGHDSVGNGKSTIATQVGTYLTWKINKLHGTNNHFTEKNMVFNSRDLATVSFDLPQYSVVVLDEGDDLTTHGMKELAVRLKRYFRKCRQLNQIIILILPSFFELPKFFALARSHFLIDVKFTGEFDRGLFNFYGPIAKKLLYMKGKKNWDYEAHRSDFDGGFFGSYCFFPDLDGCVKRYKARKYKDMVDDNEESMEDMSVRDIRKNTIREIFIKCRDSLPEITLKEWATPFCVSNRTLTQWISDDKKEKECHGIEEEGE